MFDLLCSLVTLTTVFSDESGVQVTGDAGLGVKRFRFPVSFFFFIVVHVVRNHVFNGYGYFCVRLYCTRLGFQANIVEEYVLLSALQHIFVGLKWTRDQKLSTGLMSGQLI